MLIEILIIGTADWEWINEEYIKANVRRFFLFFLMHWHADRNQCKLGVNWSLVKGSCVIVFHHGLKWLIDTTLICKLDWKSTVLIESCLGKKE